MLIKLDKAEGYFAVFPKLKAYSHTRQFALQNGIQRIRLRNFHPHYPRNEVR